MGKAERAELDTTADDDALVALLAAGVRLQSTDTLWRVSGNTLPHRALLRDTGGTWNKVDQCWEFSGENPTVKLAAALEPSQSRRPVTTAVSQKPLRTITAIAPACAC
jgi:DNA repair protein RadC